MQCGSGLPCAIADARDVLAYVAGWLQRNRGVLRGIDYTFAGVFSLFAVKIWMTQAR